MFARTLIDRTTDRNRGPSRRRGAAVVEFAVVAPLLFLVLFTTIEGGRMIVVNQILANASREGARRAVLEQASAAEAQAVTAEYLTDASISGATVTVSPSSLDMLAHSDPVTVTVSVPFASVSWLPAPMYFKEWTLSQQTVMRAERPH